MKQSRSQAENAGKSTFSVAYTAPTVCGGKKTRSSSVKVNASCAASAEEVVRKDARCRCCQREVTGVTLLGRAVSLSQIDRKTYIAIVDGNSVGYVEAAGRYRWRAFGLYHNSERVDYGTADSREAAAWLLPGGR